jgi:hypothetical protein
MVPEIGVQRLLCRCRTKLKNGLQAFADLCRIEFGLFGASGEGARHHYGNECQSNETSHMSPLKLVLQLSEASLRVG